MAATGVSLDASEFFKKLKIYSQTVLKEAEKEVATTALLIESDAKEKRFGMPTDTGRLKNSVHVITSNSDSFPYKDDEGNDFEGGLNGTESNLKNLVVAVGSNVEYASYQNAKNGFLENAIENNRNDFKKNIAKILKG
jgi:hypothetical protein